MVRLGKALSFLFCLLLFTAALPAQTEHFMVAEEAAPVFAYTPSIVVLPPLPDISLEISIPPETDRLNNILPLQGLQTIIPREEACASCSRAPLSASQEIALAYRIDAWMLYPIMAAPEPTASAILNSFYVKPIDESDKIRLMWQKAFWGMDVWLPYYNVKKIETWAKKKASFKIFKMKCSPKFQKGEFVYTCKRTF